MNPPAHPVAPVPRRESFAWAAIAFLAPVAVLAAVIAIVSVTRAWTERSNAIGATMATPAPTPAASMAAPVAHPAVGAFARPTEQILVVEVKTLKTAPPPKPRRPKTP